MALAMETRAGRLRRRRRRRRAVLVFALVLCAAVAVTLVIANNLGVSGALSASAIPASSFGTSGITTSTVTTSAPTSTSGSPTSTSSSTTTTVYVHAIPHPARIVIPTIDVDAPIVHVGLLESGDMEVPKFGLAGWYSLGPQPGAAGPAVIVAHVDSASGPDVFYRLKELEPGDEVLVYNEDGDVAAFVVDSREQQLKTALPTDRIWNDTWEPVIRLITCGGEFDRISRHYLSNVIVSGHLVN